VDVALRLVVPSGSGRMTRHSETARVLYLRAAFYDAGEGYSLETPVKEEGSGQSTCATRIVLSNRSERARKGRWRVPLVRRVAARCGPLSSNNGSHGC
jgi:hypothetical protein